jgi:nitrogen-specific signal transduction histidine kinase
MNKKSDDKPEKEQKSEKLNLKKSNTIKTVSKTELRRLEEAKREAEEANLLKSQFLASMSHELRSPLNAIFNYILFLKKKHYEQYSFLFEHVEVCTNHIMDTLKKIIDISRFHSNQFPYHPELCNIPKILSDTILTIEILALKKGLAITLNCEDADIYSRVDPYAISHAFINIIDNAIKYSEKGHIDIRLARVNPGKISIEFTDKGIGISEEFLSSIFDEFSKEINALTRRSDGTGIGMPLTKRLVVACGGTINIKSKKNRGTTVTIFLNEAKVNKRTSIKKINHPEPPNISGQTNIVVAESDPFVQQQLQMNLKKHGFNIFKALNSPQIFSILDEYRIELIIIDFELLSDKNRKYLTKLKKDKKWQKIRLIGLAEPEQVEKYQDIIKILDSFVIKPVNIEQLTGHINKLLKS